MTRLVPLRFAADRHCAAAAVLVTALALYGATLAPTVTLVDSGELIVAARTLGVAHPPGVPLWVLLAHMATWIPLGNVALRVNLASAICAALAAAALTLVAAQALRTASMLAARSLQSPRRPTAKAASRVDSRLPETESAEANLPIAASAVVAGLLLTCSRTLWSYATIAEVYTLNTFLMLTVFLLMLRWRNAMLECSLPTRTRRPSSPRARSPDRLLYGAALVFGLALGVHHVTVALTLPALAMLVAATEGAPFFKSRRLAYAALCAFAGLAVYAYLPVAASRSPTLNWGDPRTLQRLWWHVGGRQYLVSLSFSAENIDRQAREFIRLAGREFGPWWFPVGLALSVGGLVSLLRRDRTLFWFLALIVAFDVAYALNYDIAEDKDAYYLPTFVALALAAAFGAYRLIDLVGLRRSFSRWSFAVIAGALLCVPAIAFTANLPFNNRHRYFVAEDYLQNVLSTIEPRGMLLTFDWQVYSPFLYLREIEQRRRDVVAIDLNLLRRSWYFDYLRRAYPELMERTREPVERFLEDLRHWEQDPGLYERDRGLNRRIDGRFQEMILAFVSQHIASAAVLITQDVVLSRDTASTQLTKQLTDTYQLVPQGLVFQLFPDREFHEPAEPRLSTRGLVDGSLCFDADDVVTLKLLPVYAGMLYNRGRYLAVHGRKPQAIRAFEQALAIDSRFGPARRSLAEAQQ